MKSTKPRKRGSTLENYLCKIPRWELLERRAKAGRERLANRVRIERKEQKYTIDKLASKAAVSIGTLSNIENAKPVKFDSVFKVMDTLGLEIIFD